MATRGTALRPTSLTLPLRRASEKPCFLLFSLIFTGVRLLYNVGLASTAQKNESFCKATPSWTSFLFRSPQCMRHSSLCCTVSSHQLSVLDLVPTGYVSIPTSRLLPPLTRLVSIHECSSSVSLFLRKALFLKLGPGGSDRGQKLAAEYISLPLSQEGKQNTCPPSHMGVCVCVCVSCSVVSDSATPWTVACQVPLSMEFSRQEYWSGLPFPSPPHVGTVFNSR